MDTTIQKEKKSMNNCKRIQYEGFFLVITFLMFFNDGTMNKNQFVPIIIVKTLSGQVN